MDTTKPISVCLCVKCDIEKPLFKFLKNRKQCKDCDNEIKRLKYKENDEYRMKKNEQRRERYKNDEEHRKLLIKKASELKHKKVVERQIQIAKQQEAIGINNKLCKYCKIIKSKERFRHNRLKCKDCERDDPLSTIIRTTRSRILSLLKRKEKHTIEYLGCNCRFYMDWILKNNTKYTFENYGSEWHIDHVIPLSKFDLYNEEEQLIAFNWRNTMPLSVKENLSKNNKILRSQIEEHVSNLLEYHKNNNIEIPQQFIDLFAKYLDDGNPLKPSLPLTMGNFCEELS
jgi:hypothetical protein